MSSIKGRYARIELSLAKGESDKELFLTGDYLGIISISGEGSCKIKLDHRHSQELDLREVSAISGVFERVYFTTDGAGGTCTMFVGNGMAIHITPDPGRLRNGTAMSGQAEPLANTVGCLASDHLIVNDVTILNTNAFYACCIGVCVSDVATFKAHAYVLLPHQTLKFEIIDLYSLCAVSYDGVNTVILDVIGIYE